MKDKTEDLALRYRSRSLNVEDRKLLVTKYDGSLQERDLTEPSNCGGLGRIRHFVRAASGDWPPNPLPIDPAHHALGLPKADDLRAQVFQNAACNWRCWYCFVDFALLNANPKHAEWTSAADLLDRYLLQDDKPAVIDLSGGEPGIVPEWVVWMMEELQQRGLDREVYLWSDDNLSTDFTFRFLPSADLDRIASYRNYGKVCCFKGFDNVSFAFNTGAHPNVYERQFQVFQRHLELGVDLYAYVTFTSPTDRDVRGRMKEFVDRLQQLHPNLPLRTIPLEIRSFSPVEPRLNPKRRAALACQQVAKEAWRRELESRFTPLQRDTPVFAVRIHT